VALSLAEAETLRRVLHMRKHAATFRYTPAAAAAAGGHLPGGPLLSDADLLPLIDGFNTTLALRCVSDGFRVTDAAHGYFAAASSPAQAVGAGAGPCQGESGVEQQGQSAITSAAFMQSAAEQTLRFFNSDMFFSPHQLNVLLRAMHGTSKRSRKLFFKHVLSCRRRAAKKWLESSVAKLFTLDDQFAMLKHRAMAFRFVNAIKQSGLSLHDAFNKFDFDKNGLLSPGEVWGAFEYLRISLSAHDVLAFVGSADVDRDGNVSMKELATALEDPEKAEKERKRLESSENEIFTSRAANGSSSAAGAAFTGIAGAGAVEARTALGGCDDTSMEISNPSDMEAAQEPAPGEGEEEEGEEEDDYDGCLLPGPPRLQRNLSGGSGSGVGSTGGSGGGASVDGVVLPKGEDILRELQLQLTRQDEEEEAQENAAETEQELAIQREIEVEEDESDRLQEGGPNPSIAGDVVRFDFSTGRLPRRVSARGDVIYKDDQVLGKFLSVCPMSLLFISVPSALTAAGSAGLCGGRRLNQYTLVLEVMFEALPTSSVLYPVFSPAAYAETEVKKIIWYYYYIWLWL
jgi:hypothetical protein